MFKLFAVLYLLLGSYLAYDSFTRENYLTGALGMAAAALSIGLLFNVRLCGYLMAVFFLGLIGVTVTAAVKQGIALDGIRIARLAFYAAMSWTCFSWARNKT